MSRVINPDSAGKQRNQLMRTAAEILRHLSQKAAIDEEVKDMVATLVYCFHEIDAGIDLRFKNVRGKSGLPKILDDPHCLGPSEPCKP